MSAQNKKLTGDLEDTLELQGVSWLLRKAFKLATATFHIMQDTDSDGVERLTIDTVATGGIKGTREVRQLDGQWHANKDYVYGMCRHLNLRTKLSDLSDSDEDDLFLKSGWSQDVLDDNEIIMEKVDAEAGWKARGTWGFGKIRGERKHVRRYVFRRDEQVLRKLQVFDYAGPFKK